MTKIMREGVKFYYEWLKSEYDKEYEKEIIISGSGSLSV